MQIKAIEEGLNPEHFAADDADGEKRRAIGGKVLDNYPR
jgi:hypothetical protein